MALIGYTLAAVGIALYTQLDRIEALSPSENVLGVAVTISLGGTLVGFLIAIVGSAIWARRSSTRQPLKIAALVGLFTLLLCLTVNLNIHGPAAVLVLLVPFSVVNVLSVLVVTHW